MSDSPRYGRNLTRYFQSITPSFSKAQIASATRSSSKNEPEFLLQDLWSFYDEPYGHECSLTFESGENRDTYFVPYLSAVVLYTPSQSTLSESKKKHSISSETTAISSTKPLFQFFESAGPFLRVPVVDKVKILSKFCPLLLNGRSGDLDLERSWFSIFWYPILSDYNLTQPLSGSFLTYHSFEIVGRCPFRLCRSLSPGPGSLQSRNLSTLSQCPPGMTFTSSPSPPSEESAKESDESSVSSKGSPSTRKISSRSSNSSSRHSSPKESPSPSTPSSSPTKNHRKHKSKNSTKVIRRCNICNSDVCRSLKGKKKRGNSNSLHGLIYGEDRSKELTGQYVAILGFVCHNVWDATWFPVSESKHYDSPVTSRPVSPASSSTTSASITPFYYSKGYASYKDIWNENIVNSAEKSKNPHPDFIFMTRQVPAS